MEILPEVRVGVVLDPQKPDPNRRWCREYRCHGKFVKKKKTIRGDDIRRETIMVNLCVICNRDEFVPSNLKKAATYNAKIFGAVVLILNGIFLLVAAFKLEFLKGLFLCPLISILPAVGYFWLYSLPFQDWKKWAKERGWEEGKA